MKGEGRLKRAEQQTPAPAHPWPVLLVRAPPTAEELAAARARMPEDVPLYIVPDNGRG
jgi:hypothetical protein